MKKILSLLLTAIMVVSVMSIGLVSSATAEGHHLDANNIGIDIPYFPGIVNYYEMSGRNTEEVTGELIGEITETKSASGGVINLDGEVSEAEWGKPLAEISRDYAATFNSGAVSGENSYYWHCADGVQRLDLSKDFSYSVWMAWDEEFLYIAARVNDPDGPYANEGGGDIWKGDCLQFILDPNGPNSIVKYDDPTASYNPVDNPFPWYGTERASGSWKTSKYLANIGVGYLGGKFGGVEMYDMSPRYNPHRRDFVDDAGEERFEYKWDRYDVHVTAWEDDPTLPDNPIMGEGTYGYAAVKPVNNNDPDNERACTTVYEVAVPWSLFSGTHFDFDEATETSSFTYVEPDPHIGAEYGMSLVVLNGARGGTDINSWLTWGAGVCGSQLDGNDVITSGGSNSIVLSGDILGANQHEHTFAEPTCEAPYVCTGCGYKKGFAVGHNYTSTLVTPLSSAHDGYLEGSCTYCGDYHKIIVPAVEQDVWAECSEAARPGALSDSSEWYMGETEHEWTFVYRDGDGNMLFNPDGTMKTIYKAQDGQMIFDLTDGEAGTYFSTRTNRTTYSYKYDFRMTGEDLDLVYGERDNNYYDGFYHWFGGKQMGDSGYSYGMNYAAGFFPSEPGSTSGTFKIVEAIGGVSLNSEHKVLAESETIDLGTGWHEMVFVFDEEECAAFYYVDGECVVGAWDPGMSMDGHGQVTLIRKFDVSCQVANLGLGSTTAFLGAGTPAYTVTCDGEVEGVYEAGKTVNLPVPSLINNMGFRRFFTWQGANVVRSAYNSRTDTANGRTYTLTMPAEDVALTSQYVLLGDLNGDGKTNTNDLKIIKKVVAGSQVLTDPLQMEACDISLDGKFTTNDLKAMKAISVGSANITR